MPNLINDKLSDIYRYLQGLTYKHCYKKGKISILEFMVCLDMIKGLIDEQTR